MFEQDHSNLYHMVVSISVREKLRKKETAVFQNVSIRTRRAFGIQGRLKTKGGC